MAVASVDWTRHFAVGYEGSCSDVAVKTYINKFSTELELFIQRPRHFKTSERVRRSFMFSPKCEQPYAFSASVCFSLPHITCCMESNFFKWFSAAMKVYVISLFKEYFTKSTCKTSDHISKPNFGDSFQNCCTLRLNSFWPRTEL